MLGFYLFHHTQEENACNIVLHPERDQRSSTTSIMPSVDAMSRADLARLTIDTHRVMIQYRLIARTEHVRVIKKNIPAAMLRVFCKEQLDFDAEGRRRTSKAPIVKIVWGN